MARACGSNPHPGRRRGPTCTSAALVAGGLHGVENEFLLAPAFEDNAYAAKGLAHVPRTLGPEAATLFEQCSVARHAFGDDVAHHYVNMARVGN